MIGNIWLIFLPFLIIYKLLIPRNTSEPAKNFMLSIVLFLIYLFVTNTIILIHGIITGNTLITIPEGLDTFKEYFLLFKHTLPFHGVASLIKYLIGLA